MRRTRLPTGGESGLGDGAGVVGGAGAGVGLQLDVVGGRAGRRPRQRGRLVGARPVVDRAGDRAAVRVEQVEVGVVGGRDRAVHGQGLSTGETDLEVVPVAGALHVTGDGQRVAVAGDVVGGVAGVVRLDLGVRGATAGR